MFDRIDQGMYWDKAWTLVSGCTPCSPGCRGCWSAAYTHRFTDEYTCYTHASESTIKKPCGWPQFNGHIQIHPERLDIPLKRKKPTVWAIWNDLFHEDVPFEFIEDALETMRHDIYGHIFLLLTKRPKRIIDYWDWRQGVLLNPNINSVWPKNVFLGVTVCNQAEADEKIPILLQIPAAIRWLSIEPMLGPVDLSGFISARFYPSGRKLFLNDPDPRAYFNWVVLGGETGPGARPMNPGWARSVRDQCQSAGVPLFIKQIHLNGKLSKDMNDWPEDLRIRELPNAI